MIINDVIPVLAQNLKPQSILLYGSYALNLQDEHSDFDLLIIGKKLPSSTRRQKIYKNISNAQLIEIDQQVSRQKNGWDNSWSPVNDKLQINKYKLDIGYNTIGWVNSVIENLIDEHQITFKKFPFRPYTFLGLLETCEVLYDQENYIQQIQSRIRPIPKPLRNKITQEFLPILLEADQELKDYAKRNIGILSYQFHLFRGIDSLIQILLIQNDVYDPASKRIEVLLFDLKKQPPNLKKFILEILPRFYEKQGEVIKFFEDAIQYIKALK